MQDIDWKPISELPARARDFTVYDPEMCAGYRIITGCSIKKRQIIDPDGCPVPTATHFTKRIKLPGE